MYSVYKGRREGGREGKDELPWNFWVAEHREEVPGSSKPIASHHFICIICNILYNKPVKFPLRKSSS
jgi:hypothetical protein